jgi:flagellar FliL protein
LRPRFTQGAHEPGVGLFDRRDLRTGAFMAAKAKQAEAQADDKPDDDAEQPAAKPKRKLPPLRTMIVAGAAILIVGGGGVIAYQFFGHGGNSAPAQAAAKPAIFVDLPDVLVNLANAGTDRTQYLKVKIVLELPDPNVVTQIQPLMPRVMDAFQTYLRELRPTDLDGSAGLYRLKEELTRRVNAAVSPNRITAVLFKEIVVQ